MSHGKRRSLHETLSVSRAGIILSKEAFYEQDRILTEAVRSGQHLYHAIQSTGVNKKGYMSFSVLDLPRSVKFTPRHQSREPRLLAKARQAHSYEKFLEFCEVEDVSSWVEMDTVIGHQGGKVLT